MSLTKVTNRMTSADYINLVDYGADPTGVSDSTAAINAAIAAAPINGMATIVVNGLFKVNGPITIVGKRLSLIGAGMYTSGFTSTGTGGVLIFEDGSDINVQNMSITPGSDGRGLIIKSCFRPYVKGVSMRNGSLELLAEQVFPSGYGGVYWGLFENIQCRDILLHSTISAGINSNTFMNVNTVGTAAGQSGVWLKAGGDGANINSFYSCDFSYANASGAWGVRIDAGCQENSFYNCYMELNDTSIRNEAAGTRFIGGLIPGGIFVSPMILPVMFKEFTMNCSGFPHVYPFPTSTIIKNGGMEEWTTSSNATNWGQNNVVVSQSAFSLANTYSGVYAQKVLSNGTFSYVRQALEISAYFPDPIRKGGVTARAWVKAPSTNLATASTRMQITSYIGGTPYASKFINFIEDDEWHEYVIRLMPGDISGGVTSVFLEFFANFDGSVSDTTSFILIDQVTCYPGDVIGTYDYRLENPTQGTVTLAAAATTTISNTLIRPGSVLTLSPKNASAANLQAGSKSLFITNPTGSAFVLNTADGTNAAGTEEFNYIIVNNLE